VVPRIDFTESKGIRKNLYIRFRKISTEEEEITGRSERQERTVDANPYREDKPYGTDESKDIVRVGLKGMEMTSVIK